MSDTPTSFTSAERTREEGASATQTLVVEKEEVQECPPILHLRLQPPKNEGKVKWSTDTVDNEFMGKKKSKCCCIYEKPKAFGESSSSSSDTDGGDKVCTPHCRGHKKKCYRHHKHDESNHDGHDESKSGDVAGPSGVGADVPKTS